MPYRPGSTRLHKALATASTLALLGLLENGQAAAQGQANNWITIILPAEPDNIDGCLASAAHQGRVAKYNIVEPLVQKNPSDGALLPRLATKWEQTDPLTWRVTLREGVTFHDGTPFNAETAKKSMERTLNKNIICGERTKFFADNPPQVTVTGPYVLDLKTERPEPIMPMRLTNMSMMAPGTPYDALLAQGAGPVGTGPYIFESWQNGQQIKIRRNDKYWGAKPPIEGVTYIWRKESAVRASMVAIGEADMAHSISQVEATNPKTDLSFLNSETTFLRFDVEKAPLNDRRVRLALNYALDRKSMPGSVLPSSVLPATQMVFPSIPGHNHELDKKPMPYDPAKAKQLLAEAKASGVAVDTEILLVGNPSLFNGAEELTEAFLAMYRAVGFNMKIINLEPGQYQSFQQKPFKPERPPSLLVSSHDNNTGDPVFSVFSKYGCAASSSTFCDAEFDKQAQRVSSLGGRERTEGWQELFRTLYEDLVPDAMLYHMVSFIRVSPRLDFTPDVTSHNELRVQEMKLR